VAAAAALVEGAGVEEVAAAVVEDEFEGKVRSECLLTCQGLNNKSVSVANQDRINWDVNKDEIDFDL